MLMVEKPKTLSCTRKPQRVHSQNKRIGRILGVLASFYSRGSVLVGAHADWATTVLERRQLAYADARRRASNVPLASSSSTSSTSSCKTRSRPKPLQLVNKDAAKRGGSANGDGVCRP